MMTRTRILSALLFGSALAAGLGTVPALAKTGTAEQAAPAVRPEVGTPLRAAQDLAKAKKYKDAQAKLKEADAVAGKTPYEVFVLEETRGFILMSAGDGAGAARAFEAVLGTGRLSPPDALKRMQAVAQLYYQAKEYGKAAGWIERYLEAGGSDAQMPVLLAQAQYLNNDFAAAAASLGAMIAAAERAGQTVPEDQLQLLASIAAKQGDDAGYVAALERLARHYPKPSYWQDLIIRTQKAPGFSRDRLALDVYRLMLATGTMQTAGDYVEMAQLALERTLPAEAKSVLARGAAAGLVGTGAEAERHKRLIAMADRQAAEDAGGLAATAVAADRAATGGPAVRLAEAYASHGRYGEAADWFAKGIARGGLKQPDEAKLHLALALIEAGSTARARQVLGTIAGADGTGALARLWLLVVPGGA